jgi:hypothetical protein
MAIYNNSEHASVVLYDGSRGADKGQFGSNFAKASFVWTGPIPEGSPTNPWTFDSWIITDTLENVQKDVALLYSWGVKSGH